ncbi:Candidapepsin-10 [Candida viswanathii]|uniref:ferric-chelate reductase (NADPH) n=1 Tax=Candida viswanathii TaxID=5486 RepID=A0A367Y061_9ASCO|nr:Candidapepsin-10 [Candida viswanathii]
MVASRSIFFLVLTSIASVTALGDFHIYHNDEFAVEACTGYLGKLVTYFNSTTDKVGFCNVKNQPALGTMAECIEMMPHKDARKNDYLFNKKKVFNKPILLKPKLVHAAWDSVATRWYNYNYAHWFGIALCCYWYFVVFFVKSLKGGVVNAYRRYFTLPAMFKKTHAHHKTVLRYFVFVLPTRMEAILVVGWVIMALIMNLTNYVHVKPNYIWPQKSNEFGRKVADRTGLMSLWLFPPAVLFAGRNNFLQWVSGWPFARFVYIHKWMNRVNFILGIAHGVGMTYNGLGIGKYYTRNAKPYVRWGYVALVGMGVITFQSFQMFLIASVAIWGFDRAVRLARLFVFGLRTANVQLMLTNHQGFCAKTNVVDAIPRPTCFWQSHPFTVVDSVVESKTITFYIKVKGGMTHGLYQYCPSNQVSVEGPYGTRIAADRFENELFIAGGNGIPGIYYEATICQTIGDKRNIKLDGLFVTTDLNIKTTIYVTNRIPEQEQEKKSDNEENSDYIEDLKKNFYSIVAEEIRQTPGPLAIASVLTAMVDNLDASLAKRYDFQSAALANTQNFYTTNLTIGSRRQNITVVVDTGAHELWVMGSDVQCRTISQFHTNGLPNSLMFSPTTTQTSTVPHTDLQQHESKTHHGGYPDGSAASGKLDRDDIRFGNDTLIEQLKFVTVHETSAKMSVLGIGIADSSSKSLPVQVRRQGYIKKTVYSIYVNGSDAENGSILFGAIDHAKYEGTLATAPLTRDKQLAINVTYLGTNYSTLFDTGSTYSVVPDDWITELANRVNGTFDDDQASTRLTVGLGIPIEDLLREYDNRCYLGLLSNNTMGIEPVFGFNILRHMYLVYDLDEKSISVAPAIYTDDSRIQEFRHRSETVADLDPSTTTTSTGDANGSLHGPSTWVYALVAFFFYLF